MIITDHAAQRAHRRLGLSNQAAARAALREASERGLKLSPRVVQQLGLSRRRSRDKKTAATFLVSARLVLVCRRGSVCTCWSVGADGLASLLVYLMTGEKV